jgi:hypothetical protein
MDQPAGIYRKLEFEELLAKACERGRVKRGDEKAARSSVKCADLETPE